MTSWNIFLRDADVVSVVAESVKTDGNKVILSERVDINGQCSSLEVIAIFNLDNIMGIYKITEAGEL